MCVGNSTYKYKKSAPTSLERIFMFCECRYSLPLGSFTVTGLDIDSRISVSAWMFFMR